MAQAGPYDPNAYKTAAPVTAAAVATTTTAGAPESDRYASNAAAPTSVSPQASATAPASADDRYASMAAAATPSYAPSTGEDRYGIASTPAPVAATPVSPPPVAPISTPASAQPSSLAGTTPTVTASTVRIDAPAGQYRPGGTSTYSGAPTTPVEVASRPTTVTAPAAPLPSNVPIYPAGNVRTY
jgi:hypothetical protein